MPSYVFIWQDNLVKDRRVKEAKWVGHAAMNIGDHFSLGAKSDPSNYVSWWPSQSAKFSWFGILVSFARLKSQRGQAQPSLPADVVSEKYLPDHIIEVPSKLADERKMRTAWNAFVSSSRRSYNNIWENCATTVATILDGAGLLPEKRPVWRPTILHDVVATISGNKRLSWPALIPIIERGGEIDLKKHIVITHARSGAYCTSGVPVLYQANQSWSAAAVQKRK